MRAFYQIGKSQTPQTPSSRRSKGARPVLLVLMAARARISRTYSGAFACSCVRSVCRESLIEKPCMAEIYLHV